VQNEIGAGMDYVELILERLQRIETTLAALVEKHTVKEWYTTAEVAKIVGKAEYTVREWCRKGQTHAVKAPNGRGWRISHEELLRLRNEGPTPEQQAHRFAHR
jgi:excisionase family DNA binding protein